MTEAITKTRMNWDLTSYFPAFNGPEMKQFKEALQKDIASLKEKAASLPSLDKENIADWEEIFLKSEDIMTRYSHIRSYVGCLAAADARNEDYLKEEAALARMGAEFSKLKVELLRAIKGATDEAFDAFTELEAFRGAQYYLQRLREESRRRMTVEKEILAADLNVDGINAWGRLYDTISGKLEFNMEYPDGRRERLPMSKRRSLMENPDRRVRKAAFEGGNTAWQSIEDVAAAALNAISGTRLTLNRHRGINHILEVALFQSGITRKTLDALFEAVFAEIELPRRILRLKAQVMGTKGVTGYDLGAPLPLPDEEQLSWEKGKSLVRSSFTKAYPKLGNFIGMAYDKNCID
ncbi:MAG TPA: hypothetical protein VHT73_17895 [Thermodesulfobacteriota bacterium]|nr:hypothetical protein [Thermodesulfobacteriota bacterium]